jgi:serine/threonine protein kinase
MSEPTYEPASTASDKFLAALADEFVARLRRGERVTVEEYVAKHPERADRIRKAFSAIAMIEESRTSDPAAGGERLGAMIGRYKLLERIGEGGFGFVYMAEQQHPVRRKLALKVIKPGMDSRQVLARFEAERQALAIMDHPNISKVLDAGATDSGRPYFVMELVKGEPITEYCDRNQFSPRQRLELFAQVCHAVQHAHQKGIIHRDIKPTNVLVAMHDTTPVVKVIDFGVAKALGHELTEMTLFTGFAQLIGTPLYMSPEQAGHSALDIDTRSDIYSMGVLLYELLTGTTPFDKERFKKAAQDEIRRIIREEEPPRPSTRLSESKTSLPSISAQRHTEPAKLTKLVRGELDWIVMKALEKDRTRRYETAIGFAADVQRYLHDETVEACPPSRAYRLRKFARRNKVALLTSLAIFATLLLAALISTWQAIRATRAETVATDLRAKAEANSKKARQAVDDMYTQVAEKWLAEQPQMEPLQREFLEKALKYYTEFSQESSHDPAVRFEAARANRRAADIRKRLGAIEPAKKSYEETIVRLEALAAEFPGVPEYRQQLALALSKYAVPLGDMGDRSGRSEQLFRRVLAMQEKLAVEFPSDADYRRDLGSGQWHLAQVLGGSPASKQRSQERMSLYRSSLAIYQSLAAEFPAVPEYQGYVARGHLSLSRTVTRAKEDEAYWRSALEIYEKLVADYPNVSLYRHYLAEAYWSVSVSSSLPPEESEQLLRKALVQQERLAAEFPAVMDYRYDLARTLRDLGSTASLLQRPKEGEDAYRRAAAILEKLLADAPTIDYYQSRLAGIYTELAQLLAKTDRRGQAEAVYQKSITLGEGVTAAFPLEAASARLEYALLLINSGRPDEAQRHFEKVLKFAWASPSDLNSLAWPLATSRVLELRHPAWAVQLTRKSLDLDREQSSTWTILGAAQYRAGDSQAAIESLSKSVELNPEGSGSNRFFLAMAHWQSGNKAEARRWYDQAVAWMDENAPASRQLTRFRAEAAELLDVDDKKQGNPSTASATTQPQAPAK